MADDHCTLWPDQLFGADYSGCCLAHDLAYATAGPRFAADLDLMACVYQATHWPLLAGVMGFAVIVFGGLFRRGAKL